MRKLLFGVWLAAWSILACAQTSAPPDAKGCSESKVVTRMPGCWIARCEAKDFASAKMPRAQTERGHVVEGQLERTI